MNKIKPIRISAARKTAVPAVVKKSIHECDPTDIDIVVNMVSKAARQQEADRRKREHRDRVRALELREMDVARRERIVQQKEEEYRPVNNLINIVVEVAMIGFSILGMVTAIWFCWLF